MESLESLSREELSLHTDYPRGSVSDLIANTRRLRRRRVSSSAAMAVVIVIALVSVVMLQVGRGRPHPPAEPTPSTADVQAYEDFFVNLATTTGIPIGGVFLDKDNAILLAARCTAPPQASCRARLKVSTDGGLSFTDRMVAPADSPPFLYGSMRIFDENVVVVDVTVEETHAQTPGGSPTAEPTLRDRRWITSDAGRTWREGSTVPVDTVNSIPAGARLITQGIDDGPPVVLTSDGRSHHLGTAPDGAVFTRGYANYNTGDAYEGSFLLSDEAGDILVSTDRGATWQRAETAGARRLAVIEAAAGRVYAISMEDLNGETGPPVLWVSENQGRAWHPVPLPPLTPVTGMTTESPNTPLATTSIAVLTDGGVLVTDSVKMWRLAPGGTGFAPIANNGTVAMLGLRGAVIGVRGPTESPVYYLTTDGTDWRPIRPF
jgi:hypothetical protein